MNNSNQKPPIRYAAPNKMYQRDSLYISYTIIKFNASGVVGYGVPEDNLLRVDIDTILYSQDTLKIFSLIINYNRDIFYDTLKTYTGHAVIGYRINTSDPWIIYPAEYICSFVRYMDYNVVRRLLRKNYFYDFNKNGVCFWDNEQQKHTIFNLKYNAIDSNFWDSCILWKKGLSIPGYYQFQLTGNVKPGDQRAVFELPDIQYPDSILRLF